MDFIVKDLQGNDFDLNVYKGKVLLIINSAVKCGFTNQYIELEELYKKYKEDGFVILDFPCNQFGSQAKGTNQDIHEFCTSKFAITFPQFGKVDVNGEFADPLFTYLKDQKKGSLEKDISWNFTKFLIDQKGNVIDRYSPSTDISTIDRAIEELLQYDII